MLTHPSTAEWSQSAAPARSTIAGRDVVRALGRALACDAVTAVDELRGALRKLVAERKAQGVDRGKMLAEVSELIYCCPLPYYADAPSPSAQALAAEVIRWAALEYGQGD